MNDLHNAMLECLSSAQKRLDQSGGSGLSVTLMGTDKMIWHGSAAENAGELLDGLFVCAWETLRKANPEITADGFAQAAYAIAMRTEAESRRPSLLTFSSDHAFHE
jgi:hypothetical protein